MDEEYGKFGSLEVEGPDSDGDFCFTICGENVYVSSEEAKDMATKILEELASATDKTPLAG